MSAAILKFELAVQEIRNLFVTLQEKYSGLWKLESKLRTFGIGPECQGCVQIVFQHSDRDLSIVCNFAFKMVKVRIVDLKGKIRLNDGNFFCVRPFHRILGGERHDHRAGRIDCSVDLIDEWKQKLGRTVRCFFDDDISKLCFG